MGRVRVLVAVRHPLLREGVRLSLVGSGLEVCAEAGDYATAVAAAAAVRPGVCLVDTDLPGGGLAAVRAILAVRPEAAVVVLADRSTGTDLLDSVRAGAVGFLDKGMEATSLPSAIQAALAGEAVVPRRLVGQLLAAVRVGSDLDDGQGSRLTPRESEVLDLLRAGLTTSGIAERLFVSPGTVRSHVMALMRKLQVGSRDALVSGAAQGA